MFVVTTTRTVSAAALSLIPPPPTPPGPPNTDPIYGRDTFADPLPNYTLASGNYLYLAATVSGQLFPWGLQTLTNAGTIYLRDEAGYYGDLRLGPQWTPIKAFANTGTVVLHLRSSIGGTVVALADGGSDGIASSATNAGQVFLISDHFDARFYLSWQSRSSVVNSGLIALSTPEGSSTAIELVNGGTVRNEAGGQILVEGVEASGVLIHAPVLATDGSNPTEFVNAGRIEVRSSGAYASYGVWMEFGEAVNSGTVTADIAFAMDGRLTNSGTINGAVLADSFLTFENSVGGVLNGDFFGGDFLDPANPGLADVITNAGLITGAVLLFNGDDAFTHVGTGRTLGPVDLGAGNDRYLGSNFADDVIGGAGNDELRGGKGDDTLAGGAGDDIIDGGDGYDLATYRDATAGVVVSLLLQTAQDTGGAGIDTLVGIEDLVGSAFADRLTGSQSGDILLGLAGNDVIIGGGGVDLLDGGEGSDLYVMQASDDHFAGEIDDSGSSGFDEVRFHATAGSTLILYAEDRGIDAVVVGTGIGTQADTTGTTGLDVNAERYGNALTLIGNNGSNVLRATAFHDVIHGGRGNDHLYGLAGNDRLDGGEGADVLVGGAGNDTYVVSDSSDTVTELAEEGTDTVISRVSFTLSDQPPGETCSHRQLRNRRHREWLGECADRQLEREQAVRRSG